MEKEEERLLRDKSFCEEEFSIEEKVEVNGEGDDAFLASAESADEDGAVVDKGVSPRLD